MKVNYRYSLNCITPNVVQLIRDLCAFKETQS